MRFGILGDAKIARNRLRPAILSAGHVITAIGRRDPSKGADHIWGDVQVMTYEGLLADGNIEAVYIALPNHLHVPFAIKALEAGKHVICEKPVALTLNELSELDDAIQRSCCTFYDGYMVRFHPQWDWLRARDVGTRQTIHAHFSYPPHDSHNIRSKAEWGGGPIWDIGCYCLLSGLILFDGTPELLSYTRQKLPGQEVEHLASAIVAFTPNSGTPNSGSHDSNKTPQVLTFTCSGGMGLAQSLQLVGSNGWARLEVPFNPPAEAKAYFVQSSDGRQDMLGAGQQVNFPACDQYELMVTDFVKAVEEGRTQELNYSYYITKILSEIREKAR